MNEDPSAEGSGSGLIKISRDPQSSRLPVGLPADLLGRSQDREGLVFLQNLYRGLTSAKSTGAPSRIKTHFLAQGARLFMIITQG